jgi:4-hydroxybutyryl-CoA dehydratase/vinylacetyl-CoA-Delta-isomerase
MIRTKEDYLQSLRKLKPVIYYRGKRVEDVTAHPAFAPHINAAAKTYELALRPEFEDLMIATSHLTGKKINRFTHIHQSREDLIKKVQMLRLISHETGSCYQRCVGFDAMNALYSTTFEIDEKHGTSYHARLRKFVQSIQDENLMVVGSMTDPKGDRSKSPSQQADPDLFTHVVRKEERGIIIRGAKAHQTGAVNSHVMLLMPTQALRPEDQDYAIACAVPVDAPGVTMIFGRQSNEERKFGEGIDIGNPEFGLVGGEALVVLEDVFVPWEWVFMCGEYEFAGMLVERFATLHRQNYGGCKGGLCDVLVGAVALASDYMGTSRPLTSGTSWPR